MENLKGIKRKRRSRVHNRRPHNFWPARKLQFYIEYKVKLSGLPVQYLNPRGTSSLCPVCGGRLRKAPNGRRLLRCSRCGLEGDRDAIACLNLLRMWGAPVPPERLPMTLEERGESLPPIRNDMFLYEMRR